MSTSNIKYFESQQHDYTSNNLTPCPGQSSSYKTISNKSFYTALTFLIFLSFSNNLAYYLVHSSLEVLIIGIVLTFFMVILLIFHFVSSLTSGRLYSSVFFPIFYFLTGLCLVFQDPDLIRMFTSIPSDPSYLPGLLSLIVLTVTVKTKEGINTNLIYIRLLLATLSFCLVVSHVPVRGRSIYLFIVLLVLFGKDLSGTIMQKKRVHSLKYDDVPVDPNPDLDFEEITAKLQSTTDFLTEVLINPESLNQNIRKIIENIKLVSASLQKKSNIYEVKVKNVTKNLDEQDKIFIEESCFDGHIKPSVVENTHIVKVRNDYSFEVSKLSGLLKIIGKDWNFNTFFLNDCCNQIPLQVSGFYTFHNYNLDGVFKIPEATLKNFLKSLEETYKSNPYHNSIHAADVMNSHLFLLNNSKLFEVCSNLDLMTSIVAALGHDSGHPARNNRFLVITKDELAIQYNDISVLEMLHTSKVFQIIMKPESNIFANLNHDQWNLARKLIVEMILATDMSKHFDLLGQFRGKYKTPESFLIGNNDMKVEIFRLIIKAADIGHAAKDIELHERWCKLVVEEFYTQGDLEKALGLSVSMYCDRETTDISKSQAGFIRNIVLPLFTAVNFVLESEEIENCCIEQLKINENYWIHRRKSIRGRSLIQNNEEYVNKLNNLGNIRSKGRKPSLPDKYLS